MATAHHQKLVLLGPPLSGKSSVILALRELKGARIERLFADSSDSVHERGIMAVWNEGGRQFQVSTLAGAILNRNTWKRVAQPDSKFIFLMDLQATAADRSMVDLIQALYWGFGPLAALQFTKADLEKSTQLVNYGYFDEVLSRLGLPCFVSRNDQPPTLIAACCHVLGVPLPKV